MELLKKMKLNNVGDSMYIYNKQELYITNTKKVLANLVARSL